MPRYILRFLDGYAGSVVHADVFEAVDEEQAIRFAENRRGLAPMELMEGDRLVHRWPAFPPS